MALSDQELTALLADQESDRVERKASGADTDKPRRGIANLDDERRLNERRRALAADLDPQANLTSAFLDETEIESLWEAPAARQTVLGAIRPLHPGDRPISQPVINDTGDDRLALLAGDLALSSFEDDLSSQWSQCLDRKHRAFRIISAFWTVLTQAADQHSADIVLVDVGPSLGAINRAALVASDHVVIPVAPDLFSLQGLRNLGPTVTEWRKGWAKRLEERPTDLPDACLPGS
jgi:chromosome partitioning protein